MASSEAEKDYARKYYQEHKESMRAQQNSESGIEARRKYQASEHGKQVRRAHYEAHKEEKAAYAKAWHAANKDRTRERSKKWESANPEKLAMKWRKSADKRRLEILKHYGGDPPSCACCGETALQFLAVDHIDGNGNQHRKDLIASGEMNSVGTCFFQWLKRNKYPEGFRILCHNCNMANGAYGECPHTYERLTVASLHRVALRLLEPA